MYFNVLPTQMNKEANHEERQPTKRLLWEARNEMNKTKY